MTIPSLKADLLITYLGEECVVYDPELNRAHNLRGRAAEVVRALEKNTLSECDEETLAVLDLLRENGFLAADTSTDLLSRRSFVTGAVKAAALPLIATVMLPAPASAASGVTEADCEMSAGAACGQLCVGPFPFGSRVCGSISGVPGGLCGCVAVTPAVCGCV